MGFTHLHLHTEYSLLDGCCRIKPLIDAVLQKGQKSVAITDHGVMYGAVEFYKEAKARGIKPIIGCEVYVANKSRFEKQKTSGAEYSHLVLLCENNEGYQNLIKLVSLSFVEGFYSKPRIDKELLAKYSGGLIALSACLAGEIPRALSDGDFEKAKETAEFYRDTFGENNFFLELQNHGLDAEIRILPLIKKLSEQTGIPLVATNDVHYIEREDSFVHKVLLCVQTGSKIHEKSPLEFATDEFYLKTEEEMTELFGNFEGAVENTERIAERCNVEFEFGKIKLPFFDTKGEDHFEYFKKKCFEGLYKNYGENPDKKVVDRLNYELKVIDEMGYVDYYLIVWDFVNYAKKSNIPVGPGRGSGAGSLAAYCIGITGVDPIKYNLLFERFLNPERVSMPDFDIDFCYINRQKVIDYVIEKYGSDHVAQIVTFGTMAARAAVRDVGRAMDLPYGLCDKTAKLIPHSIGMTIEKALGLSKELSDLYNLDPQVKKLLDIAMKVEGMPRHASTHAAGVVISDKPVSEYVPLALNDGAVVTQYTMTVLEELGLLKMDFLGLRNLTVIKDTEDLIRLKNPDFSAENIPLDDAETYKMMSEGKTDGVFQFESEGMKNVLRRFKPERLEDLIAIISLYRPGPMDSIPKYIHNRHNPQDISYDTPLLEPILNVTYGCIVYQEQVMQIFRSLAGYSFGRADVVRRAMAKKKHDVMKKERNAFIYGEKDENGNVLCEGAIKRGVDEKTAEKIFDNMLAFSSYAFNKSHAASYAIVAYKTAYLKRHFKTEYLSSLLTSVLDDGNKTVLYTLECKRLGIKLLPPSVNESLQNFTPSGEDIRFGLLAIKNLGPAVINNLINERKSGGKYTSMYNFCLRNHSREFNRKALEGLIKSGAMDNLGHNRREMLYNIDNILSVVDEEKRYSSENQMDLFGGSDGNSEPVFTTADEMPKNQLLLMEKEATGLYLTGHPVSSYTDYIRQHRYTTLKEIFSKKNRDGIRVSVVGITDKIRVKQLKNKSIIASTYLEDETGQIEVTLFSNPYVKYKDLLDGGNIVVITGRISEREDRNPELICEKVEVVPENEQNRDTVKSKGLYIKIPSMKSDKFNRVLDLLSRNKGDIKVVILETETGKRFSAPERYFAADKPSLQTEIAEILGKDNVKFVK